MEYRDGNWGAAGARSAGNEPDATTQTQSPNLLMKARLEEAALELRQQVAQWSDPVVKVTLTEYAEMLFTAAKMLGEGEDTIKTLRRQIARLRSDYLLAQSLATGRRKIIEELTGEVAALRQWGRGLEARVQECCGGQDEWGV